jgi:hypothetical protein
VTCSSSFSRPVRPDRFDRCASLTAVEARLNRLQSRPREFGGAPHRLDPIGDCFVTVVGRLSRSQRFSTSRLTSLRTALWNSEAPPAELRFRSASPAIAKIDVGQLFQSLKPRHARVRDASAIETHGLQVWHAPARISMVASVAWAPSRFSFRIDVILRRASRPFSVILVPEHRALRADLSSLNA